MFKWSTAYSSHAIGFNETSEGCLELLSSQNLEIYPSPYMQEIQRVDWKVTDKPDTYSPN